MSAADRFNLNDQFFSEATASEKSRYRRFNLGIIGNTGVGKSSLVNAIFGKQHAPVGQGMPVTQGVNYYHDEVLGIWDFEGFEIGTQKSPIEALRENLETISMRPRNEQISVMWYCLASTADRLTLADIEIIRELHHSGIPVILVLTKVNWSKNKITGRYSAPKEVQNFKNWLENPVDAAGNPIYLPVQKVILTAAIGLYGKGTGFGLGELVSQTLALSPEDDKDAFRIAQRLDMPMKRSLTRPVIAAASSAATAAAATPIPVADATVLAPIQLAMMGRIAAIYDLEIKQMFSATALSQLGVQITGRALARSFIKLIPGAGLVVNAAVAGALTAATGEAWMRLCEQIYAEKLDVSQIDRAWKQYSPTVLTLVKKMLKSS